jgi:hypothetical protein
VGFSEHLEARSHGAAFPLQDSSNFGVALSSLNHFQ